MAKRLISLFKWWWPVIAWMAAIMTVSSIPRALLPETGIQHLDKIAHAVEYAILGILLMRALSRSNLNMSFTKISAIAIISSLCYAILDEWHQQFIPGRATDILDLTADFIGVNVGVLLYKRKNANAKSETI